MTAKIKSAAHGRHTQHKHIPRGVSPRRFERVYWPYLPIVAIITAVLAFGSQGGGAFASAALNRATHGKVLAYSTSMSIGGLLSATNSARSSSGIAGLSLNSKLNASAQAKANDMAARNYWSHNTPEGSQPWVFIDAQGYAYLKLGENLAAGFSDEQATINGWMASPAHRENLLDPAFVDVGFGFANNPDYTSASGGPMTIVVAHYGKPASAPAPPPPAAPATPPPAAPPPAAAQTQNSPPTGTDNGQPSSGSPPAEPSNATSQNSDSATPAGNPTNQAAAPKAVPATTETPTSGVTLSYKTSRAQVAFGKVPAASFATGLASFALFAVAGLWLSRHAYGLRRAMATGENFVIHHPMVDVGFATIVAIAYLMTQTAGFIK
jgi:uncharacterized protein YkwD